MATGDKAAAAGLRVVAPTEDIRMGYDVDNTRGDELAEHMTNGTHAISKIVGLTAALAAKADDTEITVLNAAVAALQSAVNNKATKSTTGDLAVGSIIGQQIGLRYETHAVFKVDGSEFELASRIEMLNEINALKARLNAIGA